MKTTYIFFSSAKEITRKKNSSIPPAPQYRETSLSINSEYHFKRSKDNTMDNIPVTDWTKSQIRRYLDDTGKFKVSEDEAERIANLDPEEVVYLNEKQWFHPKACQHYPSKFSPGEELLVTIKGTWILKSPKFDETTGYDYKLLSKKDAFIFLESNGFEELAESLAPHNPSCEL